MVNLRTTVGTALKALAVVVFFMTAVFLLIYVGLEWPDEFDAEPNWGEFILFGLLAAFVGLGAGFLLRSVGIRLQKSGRHRDDEIDTPSDG